MNELESQHEMNAEAAAISLHDKGPKQPHIEVTRPDTHPGLTCTWRWHDFDFKSELDGAEEGESIILTLKMLTEEEFKDLGDFDGW